MNLQGTGKYTIMTHNNGEVYDHPLQPNLRKSPPPSVRQSSPDLGYVERQLLELNIERDQLYTEL
jgi:hypothetical protein